MKRSLGKDDSDIEQQGREPEATTLSQQKRKREKKRRDELSEALNELSELVFKVDPDLKSGRSEYLTKSGQEAEKKSITTRTELIRYSTELIRRLHGENERKDKIISEQAAALATTSGD
eukprot:CAMPEP_0178898946 /NCGR_PEP_ID=MMETSP0786-20121207/2621_1 /TAXON_ID=186022 /ORGANISM="Thalassionema frauenfeldii, Strain CCMP 1798" /LENGTH=118 /DNA_ID=CAMNT_0020569737 /DNA_START=148 /DNA_END=501 /DNA_ORIENTATION=-